MGHISTVRKRLARPASRMLVGGFRPPDDPRTSWFGTVRVGLPDESWPEWKGRPMVGVCQINCAEAPHLPSSLGDVEMLSLFVDFTDGVPPDDSPNGEGWLLRAYSSRNALVSVTEPAIDGRLRPFPVRWESIPEDMPAREDLRTFLGSESDGVLEEFGELLGGPAEGSKVGGWPFLVQGELFWAPFNRHPANPEYVLQIDSEYKAGLSWGDQGILYIGRGTGGSRETWTMTWQCL